MICSVFSGRVTHLNTLLPAIQRSSKILLSDVGEPLRVSVTAYETERMGLAEEIPDDMQGDQIKSDIFEGIERLL